MSNHESLIQTAISALSVARDTIDIMVPLPDPYYPPVIANVAKELLPLINTKLQVRAIIATGMPPKRSGTSIVPSTKLISEAKAWFNVDEYQKNGWSIRYKYQIQSTTIYLIVDRTNGVVISSKKVPDGAAFSITGSDNINALCQQFEYHWNDPWIFLARSPEEYKSIILSFLQPEAELITLANKTWTPLIDDLNRNPDAMFDIRPRQFEELIAHMLEERGYAVTLTPQTHDGGTDVIVATSTDLGNLLYLVQCKRNHKNNPVSVALVRELYGVVEQEKATAGLIITTSYFTREAMQFREKVKHRMTLHDYQVLVKWLNEYGPPQ